MSVPEGPTITLPGTPEEQVKRIKEHARELGFFECRIAAAKEATHAEHFRKWLARGENGTMAWFHKTPERRADPRKVVEGCRSVVLMALNYYPGEPSKETNFRIARYAWNKDYHDVILPKLKSMHELMTRMGGRQRYYVDTGPILEKDFANDAGLGWNGKQTVQIHTKMGTYFILCDLLTTLELVPDPPSNDHCGKCTLCIDACPTKAIVAPHHVDARRCISYLTIENRGPIPLEFRKAIGNRIYGCDICLEVCPWNRFAKMSREASFHARESIFELTARDFLTMRQEEFSRIFTKSPIKRAKLRGMKRNACVVLGNVGTAEDLPALREMAAGEDEMLAEHAAWALAEIEARLDSAASSPISDVAWQGKPDSEKTAMDESPAFAYFTSTPAHLMSKDKPAISPTRAEDFPEWYQQVIKAADMAENSETRGCMVIKPWGYGIWELIQQQMDRRFKETGHQNAYFPLLIPLAYLEKEAEHAEGFATECAVVTHHRLEAVKDEETGKTRMVPTGKLAEPYVIRPTSETIIGAAFSRWVQSYRDLPLLINQWANVMRWEMRPRLFLRTAEFLWQEGHTAHETREQALEEARKMHQVYAAFLRNHLAIPVIPGEKTENERFPGAEITLTVEAMVQDKKAIQAGTSHYLGQNFSKAQDISFTGREGTIEYAHTTSWGTSTRMIGTLIMAHADDDGLVLPPRVAPQQIVIIPVTPKPDSREAVIDCCRALAETLRGEEFHNEPLRVLVDERDIQGGQKKWEWVKKGVPIRLEIGPRDVESRKVCLSRRDQPSNAKEFIDKAQFLRNATEILQEIHSSLLERATAFRDANITPCGSFSDFEDHWQSSPDGGWLLTPWAGGPEQEEELSKKHKISIRCLPLDQQDGPEAPCFLTGRPTRCRAIWGRSY